MGMLLLCFCFGTSCGAIMFALATVHTISSSLGMWYWTVFRVSFFYVYHGIKTNDNRQAVPIKIVDVCAFICQLVKSILNFMLP